MSPWLAARYLVLAGIVGVGGVLVISLWALTVYHIVLRIICSCGWWRKATTELEGLEEDYAQVLEKVRRQCRRSACLGVPARPRPRGSPSVQEIEAAMPSSLIFTCPATASNASSNSTSSGAAADAVKNIASGSPPSQNPAASSNLHEVCNICLEDHQAGQRVRILPGCAHTFHVDCIDLWFCHVLSCPSCRTPVSLRYRHSSTTASASIALASSSCTAVAPALITHRLQPHPQLPPALIKAGYVTAAGDDERELHFTAISIADHVEEGSQASAASSTSHAEDYMGVNNNSTVNDCPSPPA